MRANCFWHPVRILNLSAYFICYSVAYGVHYWPVKYTHYLRCFMLFARHVDTLGYKRVSVALIFDSTTWPARFSPSSLSCRPSTLSRQSAVLVLSVHPSHPVFLLHTRLFSPHSQSVLLLLLSFFALLFRYTLLERCVLSVLVVSFSLNFSRSYTNLSSVFLD